VRDPKNRLHDIADARLELAAAGEPGEAWRAAAPARFASRPATLLMAALGVMALVLGLLLVRSRGPGEAKEVVRTSIALPPGHALVAGPEITRDGQRIAFVSTDGYSRPRLYTRRLDERDLRMLGGTEEADQPFFSPDGRWIAFYARGELFKVQVDGGEPVPLAKAPGFIDGGQWLEDGTIIFTPAWNSGLYRIGANGGEPGPLLIPDRASNYAYVWPFVLPGGRALLFNRWGRTFDLMRLNLADMSQSVVAPGQVSRSIYTASGHVVFAGEGGDILALASEPSATAGAAPVTVLTHVAVGTLLATRISASDSGTLVYSPLDASKRSLVFVDHAGRSEPAPGPEDSYAELNVAPDGERAIVQAALKLFVVDLVRGSKLPLAPELPKGYDRRRHLAPAQRRPAAALARHARKRGMGPRVSGRTPHGLQLELIWPLRGLRTAARPLDRRPAGLHEGRYEPRVVAFRGAPLLPPGEPDDGGLRAIAAAPSDRQARGPLRRWMGTGPAA